MSNLAQWWATIATTLCSVLAFLQIHQSTNNKRLRRRLRIALRDCQAFYRIEESFCELLGANNEVGPSVLAVKRAVRTKLRANGHPTPSALASPQQLENELAQL